MVVQLCLFWVGVVLVLLVYWFLLGVVFLFILSVVFVSLVCVGTFVAGLVLYWWWLFVCCVCYLRAGWCLLRIGYRH